MEQSISSGETTRFKGALMILGAVAVGVGSGVGLNFFLPDRTDPLSRAERTQQEEQAEAQTSSPESAATASAPEPAAAEPSPAPEPDVADDSSSSASTEDFASSEPYAEQAPSTGESEPGEQVASDYDSSEAESTAEVSDTSAAHHQERPTAPARVASRPDRPAPPPAAQVLRPWWNATSSDPFGVQYVGQVEGQRAVAVLFSHDVGNPGELGNALKLVDESGQAVAGGWKVGNNRRLIVHSNLKPGRYTLAIDGQLSSASGQSLRTPLRGPVYIQ